VCSAFSYNNLNSTNATDRKYGSLFAYSIAFIILLIVAGVVLFYVLLSFKVIPPGYGTHLIQAAIAGVLGIAVVTVLGREISRLSFRLFGQKKANMIVVVYRFIAYIALALIVLAIVGVSATALLAGGTFAGLVLGLAAQTVLSNIIAGVMLILARPYQVGDRITFTTWQYGLIVPTYPPKFFSHDSLMPGYSGQISDIDLLYTKLQLDDGTSMKVPNSVMVVAAVVSHEIKERWVRTKYEIPNTIDPDVAIRSILEKLRINEWVVNPDSVVVLVNSTTPSSFVVSIDAICKGNLEDKPRSAILVDVMHLVGELKTLTKKE
jgi:small-conductance mechanosensitive channel